MQAKLGAKASRYNSYKKILFETSNNKEISQYNNNSTYIKGDSSKEKLLRCRFTVIGLITQFNTILGIKGITNISKHIGNQDERAANYFISTQKVREQGKCVYFYLPLFIFTKNMLFYYNVKITLSVVGFLSIMLIV